MPVATPSDAQKVDQLIRHTLDGSTAAESFGYLRQLFVERLDFDPKSGTISIHGQGLPATASRIAERQGAHVVAVAFPSASRVTAAWIHAALSQIRPVLGDDIFLVATNGDRSQWNFIYPTERSGKETLRRMVVERGVPFRTVAERLSLIWREANTTQDLRRALDHAYDVEAVTKRFFEEYRRVFDVALGLISGLDDDERKLFCQTLFNRLMFLYFLQRKGWLTFNGDQNYLEALWNDWETSRHPTEPNFYDARLKVLFFAALNNPQGQDFVHARTVAAPIIGKVPFLNGGLFEETELDKGTVVSIPDEAIDAILHQLFDRFNFTIAESTPYDIQVAVDPEMLGKVFEELVTGRHETGSYYTPRPVVSFMCREALKHYLTAHVDGLSLDVVTAFVDERRVDVLTVSQARRVLHALEEITVVDPACGSGAYLLGMLHDLIELQEQLYNSSLIHDTKTLYDQKLHIIERNLYGADIDPFAVNIAMLRLWLSLIIDFDGPADPPPLPNLDFKVVCGNSLSAPSPTVLLEPTFFQMQVQAKSQEIYRLKANFLRESGAAKRIIEDQIREKEVELAAVLSYTPAPPGSVDWRFQFSEIFLERGGFDVVLANPPYGIDSPGLYAKTVGYRDSYTAFVGLANALLVTNGIGVYIMPTSWETGDRFVHFRKWFFNNNELKALVNLPYDVFDTPFVDTCIVVFEAGRRTLDHDNVEVVSLPKRSPALLEKIGEQLQSLPTSYIARDPALRIVVSPRAAEFSDQLLEGPSLNSVARLKRGIEAYMYPLRSDRPDLDWLPFFTGNIQRYRVERGAGEQFVKLKPVDLEWHRGPRIGVRRLVSRSNRLMAARLDGQLVVKKDLYVVKADPNQPIDLRVLLNPSTQHKRR